MEHLPFVVVYGKWIWIAAVVLCGMMGPLWLVARVGWIRCAQRRRSEQLLGEPVGSLAEAADGEPSTVAGRLEAEEPTERLDDGAVVAAAVTADAVSRTSEAEQARPSAQAQSL